MSHGGHGFQHRGFRHRRGGSLGRYLDDVGDVDRYAYFEVVQPCELREEAELGEQIYGYHPSLKEFAIRVHGDATQFGMQDDPLVLPAADPQRSIVPGVADMITLSSFALGIWWCVGGPWWAAIASIIGDELDGRYARATGTTSERGALLDWGQDVTLTPLALMRLGINVGMGPIAIVAAPALLYAQAHLKSTGYRPEYGSARAVIMIAGVVAGA